MNTVFFDSNLPDERETAATLWRAGVRVLSDSKLSSALPVCPGMGGTSVSAVRPADRPPSPAGRIVRCDPAQMKPAFIHHPRCKELIRDLLAESGCDLEMTYFDVPRLRTMTPGDYLTAGLAYAFHPHRDTWFSAPPAQLNWWIPVYDVLPENTMALHPAYWSRPIRNTSRDYNYYKWNKESRGQAAHQITKDTRQQPHAEEPLDLDLQFRLVCKAGAISLFSGGSPALDGAKHVRRNTLQHRLSHCSPPRPAL